MDLGLEVDYKDSKEACKEAYKGSKEEYKDSKEAYKDFEGYKDSKGGYRGSKEGYRGSKESMDWEDWSPAVACQQPFPCWVGAPLSRPGCLLEESNHLWRAFKQEICKDRLPVCTPALLLRVYSTNTARSRDLIP